MYFVQFFCTIKRIIAENAFGNQKNSRIYHLFDVVLRDLMKNGNDDIGFPQMNPWKADLINVDSSMGFISLAGQVKNMITLNMDEYLITNINFDANTKRINFDFTWPNVSAEIFIGIYFSIRFIFRAQMSTY